MCGIVGYSGYKNCSEVLIDSLKRLEYRGYDSAGIAVFENGIIKIIKSSGRLSELQNKLQSIGAPKSNCGMGHTRWATHGEPTELNAHPHQAGKVTLVHNGIIENYISIKRFLNEKSCIIISDTDTETAAHLFNYYYHGDPVKCIADTLKKLSGSFAFGIMFEDIKDTIFSVRKESPLIAAAAENESFIASDVTAILPYTKQYYLVEENEIAKLSKGSVEFLNHNGDLINKEIKIADWDISAAEKGGYPHFMIKEIHEQPEAIKMTLAPRIKDGMPDLSECGISPERLKRYKKIFIVACGTAMHAGMVGKYVIEKLSRLPVVVDIASEFRYREPLVDKGDLVIIISQSGETADSLAALQLAKDLGAETMAVINTKGSSIARNADMLIYTHAGPEIAVASTKAYIVQLAVMYLFSFMLAFAVGRIDESECRELTSILYKTPEYIQKTIDSVLAPCENISGKLANADNLLYIGRGLDYVLSMEGSLKLKEISYIHSECYAAGELKHGTISLITDGFPVIAVATQRSVMEKTISNIKEVKARKALTILLCDEDYENLSGIADYTIKIPKIHELIAPVLASVPMQLLAYYTAIKKGNDVDKPRNLAKSVTVE